VYGITIFNAWNLPKAQTYNVKYSIYIAKILRITLVRVVDYQAQHGKSFKNKVYVFVLKREK